MRPPPATATTLSRAALTQVLCLLPARPLLWLILTRNLLRLQLRAPGQAPGTDDRHLVADIQCGMHPGGEAG